MGLDVELHYLLASYVTSVGHLEANSESLLVGHLRFVQLKIAILEACITESVPEGERGLDAPFLVVPVPNEDALTVDVNPVLAWEV